MKKLMLIVFIAWPILSFSQIDYAYEITVIDSFQCSSWDQGGMQGLGAAVYNESIHLVYHYQDTTTAQKLLYTIRTDAGFSTEVVTDIAANALLWNLSPAIQFDEFGKPHIYMGYLLKSGMTEVVVYDKIENGWQSTSLGEFYSPNSHIAADPDGSNGLGFVYWGPTEPGRYPIITYVSFNGENWEFQALSDNQGWFTKPTTVNYNNKTYVAYGEGHFVDTLITRVYVKDNLGWSLDYEDVNLTSWGGLPITTLHTLIGKSTSGLGLLTGLRKENATPAYLTNEGQGWEIPPSDQYSSISGNGLGPANRLLFDANNTAFWLSQSNGAFPTLNWITTEGKGGMIRLPHSYGSLWLYDFVIKDDQAYIYYQESSCGAPHFNGPVVFQEVKIRLNQFLPTSTNDLNNYNFSLGQNQPNPFTGQTMIPFYLSQSSDVTLKIYNIMGLELRTLINGKLPNGFHSKQFSTENLPSGTYFYQLSVDGRSIAKKFQITK